jgi:hypothetical protein
LPLINTNLDAGPGPLLAPIAVNVIGLPVSVPDDAITVFVPVAPSVNVEEAWPLLFVATDTAVSVPPPAVTANVTVAPATGLPPASVTWTVNGLARGCPTVPVWPLPLHDTRLAAGPATVLLLVYAFTLKLAAVRPVEPAAMLTD